MAEHNQVRIHINQQQYNSPNPTTGAALYALGNIAAGLDLFRDEHGKNDDEPIDNGRDVIQLKNGDHFRIGPSKTYTVYVNGEPKQVTAKRLSFDDIVKLGFPVPPPGDNILYTVSYEDGPPANPQGSLKEGGTVKVKTGMIFNVTATDRS